ncbi:hypothetical protein Tco_0822634 [Tanacetum coccineum]|uniref:Uncharacterized protein n=1 Tax=Tanacetum coccineum TaxID=301880 RepID=A0ABQ5AFM2_9ASTR
MRFAPRSLGIQKKRPHLIEDKQIPSVGVFDKVLTYTLFQGRFTPKIVHLCPNVGRDINSSFSGNFHFGWPFGGFTRDLGSFGEDRPDTGPNPSSEDLPLQTLETASEAIHDVVAAHQATASQDFTTASARADSKADLEDSSHDGVTPIKRGRRHVSYILKPHQILRIPFDGQSVFTNEWDLGAHAYSQETEGPYHTELPTPKEIHQFLRFERVDSNRIIKNKNVILSPNQVLTKELRRNLKRWNELIYENVFGLGEHRDHLPTCLAHILYCILAEQQYNLAYFFVKRIESARATPKAYLPYARHSVSSTSAHHKRGSSSRKEDDDADDVASCASTPSPTTYLNSLEPLNYQRYEIPSPSEQSDDLLFERQTELLNQSQSIKRLKVDSSHSESAPNAPSKTPSTKGTSSSSIDYIPKSPTSSTSPSTNGYLNSPTSPPPRVPPPPPTQENASMDITLTLSLITPLDVQFATSSPSLPIFGHPIPWNLLEKYRDTNLGGGCRDHNSVAAVMVGTLKKRKKRMLQSCKVTDAAVQSRGSITALHPGSTATGECLNSSTYIDYRSSYPNTTAGPNANGSDYTCPTAAANMLRPLQTLPSRHPYSDESSRYVPFFPFPSYVGLPADKAHYIHRLGRIGHKGNEGQGILLLAPLKQFFLSTLKDVPISKAELPLVEPDTKKKAEKALSNMEMKNKEYWPWLGFLSDHRPILFRESNHDYGPIPFRYFNHWTELDGFNKFVIDTWNSASVETNAMRNVMQKFKFLKGKIREWLKIYKSKNGGSGILKEELNRIDADIDKGLVALISLYRRMEAIKSMFFQILDKIQ